MSHAAIYLWVYPFCHLSFERKPLTPPIFLLTSMHPSWVNFNIILFLCFWHMPLIDLVILFDWCNRSCQWPTHVPHSGQLPSASNCSLTEQPYIRFAENWLPGGRKCRKYAPPSTASLTKNSQVLVCEITSPITLRISNSGECVCVISQNLPCGLSSSSLNCSWLTAISLLASFSSLHHFHFLTFLLVIL